MTADLRSGVQNVRIILEPRQLGRLNVELGVRNGQASIRIAAETQEAAKLLSGARGQLGQMLETAGLRLAGFQATSSHASDSGLDTSQGSQGRGGEGAAITLAVITLAVIKTFLIKWPTRWMIMPMIQPTGVPLFVRVKPQC